MRIHDNRFKDLAEVRDVDTGVLLGFAPHVSASNHIVEITLFPGFSCSLNESPTRPSELSVRYETVRFNVHNMYFPDSGRQPKNTRYYTVTRSEWERLLEHQGL